MNYRNNDSLPVLDNRRRWFSQRGTLFDTVISSRLRISRNREGSRFPGTMEDKEREELSSQLSSFFCALPHFEKESRIYAMKDLSLRDKKMLGERRILSSRQEEYRLGKIVQREDESLNVLLCLDDHIQFVGLQNGFSLISLHKELKRLERAAEKMFPFARDEQRGFLTSRINEAGTGIRASVIMQLPALSLMEDMEPIFLVLMERGLSIRGFMDDEEQSRGGLYQIYNGGDAGFKESEEILNSFCEAVKILAEKEESCRKEINRGHYPQLEDRIYRSLGALRYCRLLTAGEALKHLMLIRQGVCLGWVNEISLETLSALTLYIGQAHVERILVEESCEITAEGVDERRARLVRETLAGGLTYFGV
jgi:protein arginine kinase